MLRRAVLTWNVSCCVDMCCALLRCGSSRPWHPTPGRTDLDLELELPEPVARPELAANEKRGALDQLELKIRISSEAGRSKRGQSEPKPNAPTMDGQKRGEPREHFKTPALGDGQ